MAMKTVVKRAKHPLRYLKELMHGHKRKGSKDKEPTPKLDRRPTRANSESTVCAVVEEKKLEETADGGRGQGEAEVVEILIGSEDTITTLGRSALSHLEVNMVTHDGDGGQLAQTPHDDEQAPDTVNTSRSPSINDAATVVGEQEIQLDDTAHETLPLSGLAPYTDTPSFASPADDTLPIDSSELSAQSAVHQDGPSPDLAASEHSIAKPAMEHTLDSPAPDSSRALPDVSPPIASSVDIDPFLVDSEGSDSEDDTSSLAPDDSAQSTPPPGHEVSLALSPPPTQSPLLPEASTSSSVGSLHASVLNKDVPPAPSESDTDDDNVNELYLPGLTLPTMFLPIPNTDSLTTLLTKYVPEPNLRPPRDLSGEWQHSDLHSQVMTNNWRAIARMARDRIVAANPSDVHPVLSLWYLRLAALSRLRFFNQTSAECNNLFTVLSAVEPMSLRSHLFESVLPFELEVMRARCFYWAGDPFGYLDAMSALLRRCKLKARRAGDPSEAGMWKERGARMALIIASQLVEMKDFTAATALLEPLCTGPSSSAALRSAIARIYLQGGHMAMASRHMSIVAADPEVEPAVKDMNAVLLAAASGDWNKVAEMARKVLDHDDENVVAINNLGVALLSQGKLKEGIDILEGALHTSPSAVTVAEPFLFNLSTLYELRATLALHKKRSLLVEVAKWSGDGLKTTCLKMSSN